MSNYLSQELAVVATIDPGAILTSTNATSDWVSMKLNKKVMFVVAIGATDATSVNAIVQEATDSSGSNPTTVTGKAITALGATDDNKQAIIEVDASELLSTTTHVACKVTVSSGGSGAYCTVIGLAGRSRYEPGSANNLASVAQIVT